MNITSTSIGTDSLTNLRISDNGLYFGTRPQYAKFLYRAYVIVNDEVYGEVTVIAKDANAATVKAILETQADADKAHVILHCLGGIPED